MIRVGRYRPNEFVVAREKSLVQELGFGVASGGGSEDADTEEKSQQHVRGIRDREVVGGGLVAKWLGGGLMVGRGEDRGPLGALSPQKKTSPLPAREHRFTSPLPFIFPL